MSLYWYLYSNFLKSGEPIIHSNYFTLPDLLFTWTYSVRELGKTLVLSLKKGKAKMIYRLPENCNKTFACLKKLYR